MPGQAQTARQRALLLAAVILIVLATPSFGGASASPRLTTLRADNGEIARHSRAAILEVYALDEQLASTGSQIDSLARRTSALRRERGLLRRQIRIAERGSRLTETQLGERLRDLYEEGDVEPLEILFSSSSLDDAMSNLDSLSRMSGQAEDVLRELISTRAQLTHESRALASEETALVVALRSAQTARTALVDARSARSEYVAKLANERRLNDTQIAALLDRARAAQSKSARLTAARRAAPAPTDVSFTPGRPTQGVVRTLTVTATGYALPGSTSTGLPVGWGVVAVDPTVIPLGTHMTIPGYGEAVAADTGGAIVGDTIDLWFPTVAQASAWGRRIVTIQLH